MDATFGRFPQHGVIRIAPGGALQLQGHVQTRVTIMNTNGVVVRDVNMTENGRQLHVPRQGKGQPTSDRRLPRS